jgi:paraquat-inducible protein B
MATWHPKRVGAFVLMGAGLLVVAVLVLGSGALFSRKHTFVSYFSGSVSGLRTGAPVKLRGITIGQVRGVYLTLDEQIDLSRVPVIYEVDERLVRKRGAAGDRIGDPEYLEELLGIGLRAQMGLESFVTGQRYIELDFFPDAPMVFAQDPEHDHPEIPVFDAGGLQADLHAFVDELRAADIAGLIRRLSRLAERADSSVADVRIHELRATLDSTLGTAGAALQSLADLSERLDQQVPRLAERAADATEQLNETLQTLDATLRTIQAAVDPESPVAVGLEQSLSELGGAARALRELLEFLERNPGALLRGRLQEEQP